MDSMNITDQMVENIKGKVDDLRWYNIIRWQGVKTKTDTIFLQALDAV